MAFIPLPSERPERPRRRGGFIPADNVQPSPVPGALEDRARPRLEVGAPEFVNPPTPAGDRMVEVERSGLGSLTEPVHRGLARARQGITTLFSELGGYRGAEGELQERLRQQQRGIERFPVPEDIVAGQHEISEAEGFGSAARAIVQNPRAVLETTLESLGRSVPSLVGAAAGSVFGPAGTAAGAGAGSFATEYTAALAEAMAERGKPLTDPGAIHDALQDERVMAAAREKAVKRGIPIAAFDALTAGLAGRLLAGAKPTVGSVAGRVAGEAGLQAAGGAAGEATAQFASEGRITSPGEVLLEAVAEIPSAAVEVPANVRAARAAGVQASPSPAHAPSPDDLVEQMFDFAAPAAKRGGYRPLPREVERPVGTIAVPVTDEEEAWIAQAARADRAAVPEGMRVVEGRLAMPEEAAGDVRRWIAAKAEAAPDTAPSGLLHVQEALGERTVPAAIEPAPSLSGQDVSLAPQPANAPGVAAPRDLSKRPESAAGAVADMQEAEDGSLPPAPQERVPKYYETTQPVRVTLEDGRVAEYLVKGLNAAHALWLAQEQIFPGAKIEALERRAQPRPARARPIPAAAPVAAATPAAVNSFAPGSQYTPLVDDAALPGSAGRVEGTPIRREDVLIPFLEALDVPIYEGRVRGRRLGFYLPHKEAVRIKNKSDLEVAVHELAHLIDDRVFNGFGTRKGAPKTRPWVVGPNAQVYAKELASVSYDKAKVYEGWAEWVRLWMTQPDTARAAAPEFTKWFEFFVKIHKYGPAILKAREGMRSWFQQDALNRARSKIGESRPLNEFLDGFWDRFRQTIADDLDGIYRMERELTGGIAPVGTYETARTTRGAHALVEGSLRYGHPLRKADGSTSFEGPGLEQILAPVSENLEEFLLYSVGRSAHELAGQGREHLFTPSEIRAMVGLDRPEFRRAFEQYQAWNKGIVDFAERLGIINPETRALWRRAQYLPFYRVQQSRPTSRAGGVEGNWSGIHQLTGGTGNVRDVLGNIVQNAQMLITEALRNEARVKVAALAEMAEGGGRFMVKIAPESRKVGIDRDQVRAKVLEAAGLKGAGAQARHAVKFVDLLLDQAPEFFDFFMHGQSPRGDNVVAVMRNGKPVYYEVADPVLYRAISALHRPAQSKLVKWLGLLKRIGQASIVLTPDFAAANIMRDALMGGVMSRAGFLPAVDSIRGLTSRLTRDPAYREYLANGGGFASYFVDPEGAGFRAHLERFYARKGLDPKRILDTPGKLLYGLEQIFDSFEVATRLGEYKRARAKGEHPRHAAYLAREISTDFAMKGDSEALGFLYDTVMFLRPAVVSMDRLFRGVAHDRNAGAVMAKSAAIALVSAALYLLNRGRPEYDDLELWDRDNYWHFFVPRPSGETLHLRMPKIWEVGALATLAERAVERTLEENPGEYAKDFARVISHQFGLNLMPQVLAPLYEQATNKNTFTGRRIEPLGMENLQPFLRAKPTTSETMKALGMATRDLPEALQVNPARAEALLRGYLNTWAFYGLLLTDEAFFSERLPERRLDQLPVLRRFLREEPSIHTKHETKFYELLDEAKRLRGTMRELDELGRPELGEKLEQKPLAGAAPGLERVQRSARMIANEMEEVRRATDLSREEKRKRLDELTRERNALFKEAVREAQP